MRPKQPAAEPQEDLFRARLETLVDPRHALVRLAGLIDWGRFEAAFGPLYTDGIGRPGLPTRPMAGLHLLKHMDGLSDGAVCTRYLDRSPARGRAPSWRGNAASSHRPTVTPQTYFRSSPLKAPAAWRPRAALPARRPSRP